MTQALRSARRGAWARASESQQHAGLRGQCAVGSVLLAAALWRRGLVGAYIVNTPLNAHFYVRLDDGHGQWVLDVTATQFSVYSFSGFIPACLCLPWREAQHLHDWRTIWWIWTPDTLDELAALTRRWHGGHGAVLDRDVARARRAREHGLQLSKGTGHGQVTGLDH